MYSSSPQRGWTICTRIRLWHLFLLLNKNTCNFHTMGLWVCVKSYFSACIYMSMMVCDMTGARRVMVWRHVRPYTSRPRPVLRKSRNVGRHLHVSRGQPDPGAYCVHRRRADDRCTDLFNTNVTVARGANGRVLWLNSRHDARNCEQLWLCQRQHFVAQCSSTCRLQQMVLEVFSLAAHTHPETVAVIVYGRVSCFSN